MKRKSSNNSSQKYNGQSQDYSSSLKSDSQEQDLRSNGNYERINFYSIEAPKYNNIPVMKSYPASKPPQTNKILQKKEPKKRSVGGGKSIDFNKIESEKVLSPKEDYNFNPLIGRSKSSEKLSVDNQSTKSKNSSNEPGYSSVHYYLQRRHTEAQAKLVRLKNEQTKKETEHLRDRPIISKKSKKIVENIISNKMTVVDRLTSKCNERKKIEEISRIQDQSSKMLSKPQVYYN
jgi:hypothetical protein